MKKRPLLMATLTIGGLFLFFLLVVLVAGHWHGSSDLVPVGDRIGVLDPAVDRQPHREDEVERILAEEVDAT